MPKKLTLNEFINRSQRIFGDRYDYSSVEYINNSTKVKIYDKELSEYFFMTPANHLKGQDNPSRKTEKLRTRFSMGKDEFIKKAKGVHGDKYDYSKVVYERSNKKICIVCPEHGEFWQKPSTHLNGCGCPECFKKRQSLLLSEKNKKNFTTEDFIFEARKVHGNKYDYSNRQKRS